MNVGRKILAWAARHALALAGIVLILLVARYAAPVALAWAGEQRDAARTLPAQRTAYAEALRSFETYSAARRAEVDALVPALASASNGRLRVRRAALPAEAARLKRERLNDVGLASAAIRGDSPALFMHYRAGAELALLEREAWLIDRLLAGRAAEGRRLSLEQQIAVSQQRWTAARSRAQALEARPLAAARNAICARVGGVGVGCENYRALVTARRDVKQAAAEHRRARAELIATDQAKRGMAATASALKTGSAAVERERVALTKQIDRLDRMVSQNWLLWIRDPVAAVLPTALLILFAAIFGPALIKCVLFFGLAPLAVRRPPLRLLRSDRGEVVEVGRSAAWQEVPLQDGEELLVVPEALQSTPHGAIKSTRWLLDWRMPFGSLASGLVALVSLRARQSETVIIAATGDPLAEIALIRLERGSAMVLRPRALRGLVQPIGEPMQITRRWRLGASAWLILQFRYLIFHGPCTLIVQGTRGVRLERTEIGPGRGVNQAAMIGFSAGLFYAVSRSEAFGAYLLGKQELYNDSFHGAEGAYLYEVMPLGARAGGVWGRGVRGLGDAALKIVGL